MDAEAVEAWVKKKPRPKILRLVTGDTTREIKVHPGQTWRPIVESLLDMEPDRIEALDADGGLLRAVSAENETVASPPTAQGSKRTVLSATAVHDPESQRFILFAQLLAEAYRHANEVAFARMVDLFEAVNDRHETTERLVEHLHKLLHKAAQQALDGEATPADPLETLVKAFTGGMEAGAANGKAEA